MNILNFFFLYVHNSEFSNSFIYNNNCYFFKCCLTGKI